MSILSAIYGGIAFALSHYVGGLAPQPLKPLLTGCPARRDHLVPISCTNNKHP